MTEEVDKWDLKRFLKRVRWSLFWNFGPIEARDLMLKVRKVGKETSTGQVNFYAKDEFVAIVMATEGAEQNHYSFETNEERSAFELGLVKGIEALKGPGSGFIREAAVDDDNNVINPFTEDDELEDFRKQFESLGKKDTQIH